MVVNSKIRDSDWLTFTLTIVNFNYVFIQPAPEVIIFKCTDWCFEYECVYLKRVFKKRSKLMKSYDVIYEQRERVFHRDIQTRENNGENTSAQRECFCPLFSSVWISR